MKSTEYIEEFLYRGNHDGTGAWHVQVYDTSEKVLRTLSIPQALAEGITLPEVLEEINTASLLEIDRLRAIIDAADGA